MLTTVLARRALAALLLCSGSALAAVGPVESEAERLHRTLLRSEAQALENGEGVERDPERAARLYCQAARLGDAESQFNLGWMYANGRGVERSDSTAAYFFHAAAEQGLEQAVRMLDRVGGPPTYTPDCMREPEPARAATAVPRAAAPVPAPAAAAPAIAAPPDIARLVKRLAPQYGLAPQLVLAFIQAESNFDVVALSPKNAKGLMQLIPDTAARFNVHKPYDPEQNVRGGMAYLRWLLSYYRGDVILVAAAYNAGEGTVNRYRGVPPYAETRAYVRRILAGFGQALHPFDRALTEPAPLPQLR
ncbi:MULTISPECIES: transglycosylase SLT domain-containing protein [Piscinibacter]|uniref:transglycosylase SLT domain-containing protein n=1 Tax=Piscinibacter TaxID=1114981 RepID=UPI000FDE310B|nr:MULTISPECIES: transglycosylase SLT domain-containing protein [Piscinibacter]